MAIKQTQPPEIKQESEGQQRPLLQITLPAPPDMNPSAPLTVGNHNACAQKNFNQVANILLATISNQKLISLAITEQDKKIKELQKNIKIISDNIRELLKENKNEQNTRKS